MNKLATTFAIAFETVNVYVMSGGNAANPQNILHKLMKRAHLSGAAVATCKVMDSDCESVNKRECEQTLCSATATPSTATRRIPASKSIITSGIQVLAYEDFPAGNRVISGSI